jgi:hypothetical protein
MEFKPQPTFPQLYSTIRKRGIPVQLNCYIHTRTINPKDPKIIAIIAKNLPRNPVFLI